MNTFFKFIIVSFISVFVFNNISASAKIPVIINDSGLEFRTTVGSAKVGDALEELRITLQKEDIVLPSLESNLRPTERIFIKRSIPVSIQVDGQTKNINTHSRTVAELIGEQGIEMKELDKSVPSKDASLVADLRIEIIRVTKGILTKEIVVPMKKTVLEDVNLSLGKIKVVEQGGNGLIKEEWEVTYENNKEITRKLVKKTIVREMKLEIIAHGTKIEIGQTYTGLGTWYDAPGRAASLQFPFGTKVRVINLETNASTIVTINDRGPYGQGRIIDLAKEAFEKLAPSGKGIIKVKVEEIL